MPVREFFAIRPNKFGGRGDYAIQDIRMATTAIRKKFDMSPEWMQDLLVGAKKIVDTSEDEKTRLLAIKLMLAMEQQDFEKEKEENKPAAGVNIGTQVNIQINEQVVTTPEEARQAMSLPVEKIIEGTNGKHHGPEGHSPLS